MFPCADAVEEGNGRGSERGDAIGEIVGDGRPCAGRGEGEGFYQGDFEVGGNVGGAWERLDCGMVGWWGRTEGGGETEAGRAAADYYDIVKVFGKG